MMKKTTVFTPMFRGIVAMCCIGMFGIITTATAQFPQRVVIEEFTSVTCAPCVQATKNVNKVIDDNDGNVVSVRYHLNFPTPGDPWYAANPSGNNDRSDFYGQIIALPDARVNGFSAKPDNEAELATAISDELASDAPVKIDVTQTREGGNFSVKVDVTAGPDGLGSGYKLFVSIVEAEIHEEDGVKNIPGYNGETEFFDVFRAMLPSASGDDISLGANETKTFNYDYSLGQDWQSDQMYAVAFVQDDFDLTVIQVGNSPKPEPSSVEPIALEGYDLEVIAPNPTSGTATVRYVIGVAGAVSVDVHDVQGRTVTRLDEGTLEAGTHTVRVDVSSLPAGLYTVTIRSGEWRISEKLTIVK